MFVTSSHNTKVILPKVRTL